jgi:glycosyltransferase involved in cell wall biosynthesis
MSGKNIKFSIVIPVYNAIDFIGKTLDSVRHQSYENYEVLVTIDGSTDGSENILKEYKKKYPGFPLDFISQKNNGVSSARNNSISRATGDYIAFLDQDDFWLPKKLKEVLKAIEKNNRADVFYHEAIAIGWKRKVNFSKNGAIKEPYYLDLLLNFNRIGISTAVVKRDIVNSAGCFDTKYKYSEDYDLWLKVARSGGVFHYIPLFLSKYIWRPECMSNKVDNMTSEKIDIFEKNCRYLFDNSNYNRRYLNRKYKKAKSRIFFGSSRRLYYLGDYKKSRDYCIMAIKTDKKFCKSYIGLILSYVKSKIDSIKKIK